MNPSKLMSAYLALKEQRDLIDQQMVQIKTQLGQALPTGGKIDGHTITHQKGRIAWSKVEQAFPHADFPQLYSQAFNTKLAEKEIAPAVLDQYRGAGSVTIR